jgi:hypothetical protein
MTTRKATAKAKGNGEGKRQKAKTSTTADPFGMTTRRGKAKGEDKVRDGRRRAHADFSRVRREAV